MGETIERYSAPPAASTAPRHPDFSRIPAYVEPPRPPPAKQAQISPGSATALLAVATGTLLCFGAYVYFNQAPAPASSPPERVQAVTRLIQAPPAPQDVPLPSGLQLSSTAHVKLPAQAPRHHFNPHD